MNSVQLIGRLTKDPEVRYNTNNEAIARFNLAIDRGGKEKEADFIPVVCFKKTAELVEKYVKKGKLVAVEGSIRTGSYENKEGKKIYTTDVFASRIEFLSPSESKQAAPAKEEYHQEALLEGFAQIGDDDIPF